MSTQHDRTTGGFIAAPRLHPHVAIFNNIGSTHTVRTAAPIQGLQYHCWGHRLTVDSDDIALVIGERNFLSGIGRCLGAN